MVTMSLNSAVKLVGLFTVLNYTWTPPPPEQHGLSHTSVPESHSVPLLPLASRGQRPKLSSCR